MAQPKRNDAKSTNPDNGIKHSRERRLSAINERLRQLGLAPLRKLGDYKQGEFEYTGILGEHHFGNYFVVVMFAGIQPDGQAGTYSVLMNARHVTAEIGAETEKDMLHPTGAVCLVTINNSWLVLVRQHRPTMGRWVTEIPRGYIPAGGLPFGRLPRLRQMRSDVEADPAALKLSNIPFGIVGQELAPMISSGLLTLTRFRYLGAMPENTGNSSNMLGTFHIDLHREQGGDVVEEVQRRSTDILKVRLVPLKDLETRCWDHGLESAFCLAALSLFFRAERSA